MMTLNDGRSELWQWDTGRTLSVDADCSQVHFSNKIFGRSIDVDVVEGVAIIPDILLQTDKELTAWAFVGTAENGYTKISKVFKVNKRNKPADYVFTPTDQTTLGEILDRIEDLENRPSGDVSKEDIQNAVNDYLDKNPISVEETDPTVPDWAKQPEKPTYTAAEVGALPADTPIPDGIPIPSSAQVGQTIVVKAVDENGKPTEWETAELPSGARLIEDCELIAYGKLEANGGISISKDKNGNTFSLSKAILIVNGSAVSDNTLLTGYNEVRASATSMEAEYRKTTTKFTVEIAKGDVIRVRRHDNHVISVIQEKPIIISENEDGTVTVSKGIVTESIYCIYVRPWNSGNMLTAGTIYALYGVRE